MPKKSIAKKSVMPPKKGVVKKEEPKEEVASLARPGRYIEAVGRRKTAIARVRLSGGRGKFIVNEKEAGNFFQLSALRDSATAPISKLKLEGKYDISAKVLGGGIRAQAEAVRLGLARALAIKNPDFKKRLRKLGFLTRDPRMVERKKYGLKKARRAPQWAKR